jgi:hypothetical protein
MPKFIKDDSKELKGTSLVENTVQAEKEILSPLYFPPKEDQMRQKDVATMFGKSTQTICSWTKLNKIPYFRLGDYPIYSRKQLILFASKNHSLISSK